MIKIVTDSACNLTAEETKALNVEIIPLTINFGDEEYSDGIDISAHDFYEKLESAAVTPTTSQISPAAFEEVFKKHINSGDEVVGIFISSDLSGTFQSAHIAAMGIESDNIHLVDSRNVAIGEGLVVKEAAKLRDAGLSADKIAEACQSFASRVCVLAVVDSLKYLKMGGRLSTAGAAVGSLLKIVPVLSVIDGKVAVVTKSRGAKAALKSMLSYIHESNIELNYGYAIGHANSYSKLDSFVAQAADAIGRKNNSVSQITAAIGTHLGPGTLAVAFVKKEAHASISKNEEISA